MFFEKELAFLRKTLEECNLQNYIISPDDIINEALDRGLQKIIGANASYKTFRDYFPDIRKKTVYRVCDLFFFTYIFFTIPFGEKEKIFITGPYLNTDITSEKIHLQAKAMSLSESVIKELELFYSALPIVKDEHLIFALINTFAKLVYQSELESADIRLEKTAAFIPAEAALKHTSTEESVNFSVLEDRYNFENELIEAVARGNSRKAELMMARFSVLTFEQRTDDTLRNIKNYCIIMNTLLRKAAEKGGVHPYYLNKVSSDFAVKTELLNSVGETAEFMQTIMRTYCNLVKNHSIKNFSPIIQKAILRIENDLSGDINLKSLSSSSGVSPGYFSALFKKETGASLTEYVNLKRVAYAKQLLKSTNLQIQQIAQACGILDFHYFCRIFKKITGKTPSQYRNSISFE